MTIATKLFEYVEKAGIAEFSVLESLRLTSPNSLRVTLSRLTKAGKFYSPAKGVYVSKGADPFMVATILKPGYLSLGTALHFHHLIEEYPFTIHIAASSRGSFRMGEHELFYFKAKNYLGLLEKPYKMASVEKAIYDCLLHADLVGFAKIAKALYRAEISSKKFLAISKTESSAFFQRLGYVLSLLPNLGSEKKRLLEHCRGRICANAYLQGRGKGKYVSEWKLVDNVGEKVILSWWHQ